MSMIIIVVSFVLCGQLIVNSLSNQKIKSDYAELNHVKFGLLNVDVWKQQIGTVLTEEIDKLNVSRANKQSLKKKTEELLYAFINKLDKEMREKNAHSPLGLIKQGYANIFGGINKIKEEIPNFSDLIVKDLSAPKTMTQVKAILKKQLEKYLKKTAGTQDTSELVSILQATGSTDVAEARLKLEKMIQAKNGIISRDALLIILFALVLFIMARLNKHPLSPPRFYILVLTLFTLLLPGVTTPMIDVRVLISKVSFVFMGHSITFGDQVLYFRSKSILDVFRIMIADSELLIKSVGVLVITFSVFFPLLKICSLAGYYFNFLQARENPVIRFFVFKSGKWSMADVFAVSIFMAYVGFNGVINSGLNELNTAAGGEGILTTNGTTLQPGYYLFLTYTLLSLILSGLLTSGSNVPE
ncbi:MAG: paraquat-inducible protein A [Endomicrobiales bacterium]